MSLLTEVINKILAVGTVVADGLLVTVTLIIILRLVFGEKEIYGRMAWFFHKYGLFLAFLTAAGVTVASLYYSDIIGYEPCKLCWLQRIFVYPQVVILVIALWTKDRRAAIYCLALSLVGVLIAIDHNLLQYLNVSLLPCSSAVTAACNKLYVYEFGYVTIPIMSLTSFLWLIVFTWFACEKKEEKK